MATWDYDDIWSVAMLEMYRMKYFEDVALDHAIYGRSVTKMDSDGNFERVSPYYEGVSSEVKAMLEPHQCTCDSLDLFRHGCKCGGV